MKSTVVVLFAIICAVISVSDAQSCKDENNNDVDWFYMYKLPKNKFSQNPLIKQGVGYLYITPQTIKNGWTLSTKSINDSSSIPGLTLSLLYRKDEDHLAVIYNDQPFVFKADEEGTTKAPTTKKPKLQRSKSVRRSVQRRASTPEERKRKKARNDGDGHTKGVVIGDGASGIWLVHSVPKFPPLPEKNSVNIVKYYYPETARRYGQSFLCMSLKAATLDQVGQQLCYNEPKILYSQVPNNWKANVPRIVDVIDHKTVSEAPWSNVANITTKKGMKFLSFAKSGNFKDDIYEGLVATSLKSDLFVESWINGAGVLESNCSYQYKVNNVEKVAFAEKGIAFSSHADHSKWAVSAPPSNRKKGTQNWICVGDINRAETQELRGGGTVCTQNYNLWTHYSTAINEIEPCKKPPKNG